MTCERKLVATGLRPYVTEYEMTCRAYRMAVTIEFQHDDQFPHGNVAAGDFLTKHFDGCDSCPRKKATP
jgi:hypothetical protein